MDTPLHLEEYFFPVIQTIADADYDMDQGDNSIPPPEIKVNCKHGKENIYQVTVNISLVPEDEENLIPYTLDIIAVGIFRIDKDWPDPEKLAIVNGGSILYSAARELIITVTSRGPWGAVTLPTFSFLRYYQEISKTDDNNETEEPSPTEP